MTSNFEKAQLIQLIQSNKAIDTEFKMELINQVEIDFGKPKSKSSFKIMKIKVERDENTLYRGAVLNFTPEKSILFITGPNYSGKTCTFDKIQHFFMNFQKKLTKKSTVQLTLYLKNIQDNQKYLINYKSQMKTNEMAQVNLIDEKGFSQGTLPNSFEFLEKNHIIEHEFNHLLFIPDIKQDSYVKNYCSSVEKLRIFLRFRPLAHILSMLEVKITSYLKIKNRLDIEKSGYDDKIQRTDNRIALLDKKYILNKNIYDHRTELLEAFNIYDNTLNDIKKVDTEIISRMRKISRNIRDNDKLLKELQDFSSNNISTKEDAYIQSRDFLCSACGKLLAESKLRERIVDKICWNCGIYNMDYSDKLATVDFPDVQDVRKRIREIEKINKELEKERKKISSEKPDLQALTKKFTPEIWKQVQLFESQETLMAELDCAKSFIDKYNDEKEGLKSIKQDISKQKKDLDKKSGDISLVISSYEEFKNQIIVLEDSFFNDLKDQIILFVNQFLINIFQDEDFGRIYYDNNSGELSLVTHYSDESNPKKINSELNKCYSNDSRLSQGQVRKIDFAFSLAFCKMNKDYNFFPINALFIDGLDGFNPDEQELLLNNLIEVKDINFIILSPILPVSLNESYFDHVELKRNDKRQKDPNLKLTIQKKLF